MEGRKRTTMVRYNEKEDKKAQKKKTYKRGRKLSTKYWKIRGKKDNK